MHIKMNQNMWTLHITSPSQIIGGVSFRGPTFAQNLQNLKNCSSALWLPIILDRLRVSAFPRCKCSGKAHCRLGQMLYEYSYMPDSSVPLSNLMNIIAASAPCIFTIISVFIIILLCSFSQTNIQISNCKQWSN